MKFTNEMDNIIRSAIQVCPTNLSLAFDNATNILIHMNGFNDIEQLFKKVKNRWYSTLRFSNEAFTICGESYNYINGKNHFRKTGFNERLIQHAPKNKAARISFKKTPISRKKVLSET